MYQLTQLNVTFLFSVKEMIGALINPNIFSLYLELNLQSPTNPVVTSVLPYGDNSPQLSGTIFSPEKPSAVWNLLV
jgi:hypothetical protein